MNKKAGAFTFFIIIILLAILAIASYYLYHAIADLNVKPIDFILRKEYKINLINQPSYSKDLQFYSNMRFAKKDISFNIDYSCNEKKQKRMLQAFERLKNETGLLNFFLSEKNSADIFVSCDENEPLEKVPKKAGFQPTAEYFIAGEGGPALIINGSIFSVIEKGKVLLFYEKSECNNYNVELHELLHVFGFKHADNEKSIMYNTSSCDQALTKDIIDELIKLYSFEEFPDLFFSNISASKHGIYLDFYVEIENQGLNLANNSILELYYNEKKFEEFEFEAINYGEKRILDVKNLKLPSRKTDEIKFIISAGKELEKGNNEVALGLKN